jgi:hypothetical protein
MAGEIRGHTGWFPESYVEPVDAGTAISDNDRTFMQQDSVEKRTLESVIFSFIFYINDISRNIFLYVCISLDISLHFVCIGV